LVRAVQFPLDLSIIKRKKKPKLRGLHTKQIASMLSIRTNLSDLFPYQDLKVMNHIISIQMLFYALVSHD
jgi:hypothetical protein